MNWPKKLPKKYTQPLLAFLFALQESYKKNAPRNRKEFEEEIKRLLRQHQLKRQFKGCVPNFWWLNFLILRYGNKFSPQFISYLEKFLIKTKTRSLSGIIPVTVFTKGKGCSFHCLYCPDQPQIPKSYLSDEPAVMRARQNKFDPFAQTKNRLIALALSGHPLDKVEIIIKGGSFSCYSQSYRQNFIKRIFEAANLDILKIIQNEPPKISRSTNFLKSQRMNEKASSRIIGINVETRPDLIDEKEIIFLRQLGVTQVELGVQALDDSLLTKVKRGHDVACVKKATFLLKEACFKISYHLMPNLPGSNPAKDFRLLQKAFGSDFCPDHLKIYPTVISKYSRLEKWYQKGKYQPYPLDQLVELLADFKSQAIPAWVRISRLARDISKTMISGPQLPSNLRQIVQKKLKSQGRKCSCIRCREIKDQPTSGRPKLKISVYPASQGREYFLEYTDQANQLLGFLRLRIPASFFNKNLVPIFPVLKNAALIRELHIFGPLTPIGKRNPEKIQHQKLGGQLLKKAEAIAQNYKLKKIAVISGVGVRNYYRKFGYRLSQTYLVKNI